MAIDMGKTLAFTAISGMVAGLAACGAAPAVPDAAVPGTDPAAAMPGAAAKECCKGKNECKGKGGCKTDANECKGKNECKTKGGCKSGECADAPAVPEAPAAP